MPETSRRVVNPLPMYRNGHSSEGYNATVLMRETSNIRKMITKRGTI
jgi:hypothetical protein